MTTEVLSVRVKKNLKDEAEKLGVDLRAEVKNFLNNSSLKKRQKRNK